MKKAIVISASSDIGVALARHWASLGWEICGTYRTDSPAVKEMRSHSNIHLFPCDLLNPESIKQATQQIIAFLCSWDIVVFAAGTLSPIGSFHSVNFQEWEDGIRANFLGSLSLLHALLPFRNHSSQADPVVLFFAGGGTNHSVKNYSCYTISKIALIKMVELLDAEIPDTRFCIVGPGWVKTKIHEQTLQAKEKAGDSLEKTKQRLNENQFIPMESVVECCHWLATTSSKGVGGRNISVTFDQWGTQELEKELEADADMYKLRRYKNSWRK